MDGAQGAGGLWPVDDELHDGEGRGLFTLPVEPLQPNGIPFRGLRPPQYSVVSGMTALSPGPVLPDYLIPDHITCVLLPGQGEANSDEGFPMLREQYACAFGQMISGWRAAWNAPMLPFGFVQLSSWTGNWGFDNLPCVSERFQAPLPARKHAVSVWRILQGGVLGNAHDRWRTIALSSQGSGLPRVTSWRKQGRRCTRFRGRRSFRWPMLSWRLPTTKETIRRVQHKMSTDIVLPG